MSLLRETTKIESLNITTEKYVTCFLVVSELKFAPQKVLNQDKFCTNFYLLFLAKIFSITILRSKQIFGCHTNQFIQKQNMTNTRPAFEVTNFLRPHLHFLDSTCHSFLPTSLALCEYHQQSLYCLICIAQSIYYLWIYSLLEPIFNFSSVFMVQLLLVFLSTGLSVRWSIQFYQ